MIREPQFCEFALKTLLPFAEQFPIQYLQGQRHVSIAYRHFTHDSPEVRKLLIIVNGRAENMLKWTEVAFDFYHQGYDVLVFDHRGQGYSQRLLADPEKGYIDEFRFYAEDMHKIIENVTALFPYQSQHLLAHSMGALISSFYLANYDHQIKSAVFSAPFFGLLLQRPIIDELAINLMILFGQGKRYVFGKTSYKPAHLDHNDLSFCKTRMKWHNRIQRKNKVIRLGGPTFRWVHLCLNAIKQLPQILPRIEIPVLIVQSDQDKIVNNQDLPKLTSLLPKGELWRITDTKHEVLFERDCVREQALQRIFAFFM
ncbi:alpha/beta fold hydrolase [Conservatibacter flavescens]|uniref:Lysophospholipase n=1 Tax=Conservatibacter flavescens TaxID=28161 RepID=A0A2M8S4B2_9PAST|nr:alpha/beta hydrolase [Conservatibacter flavescens]PJG85986.1 lysophospholipase [Conservatibacter flavescens]